MSFESNNFYDDVLIIGCIYVYLLIIIGSIYKLSFKCANAKVFNFDPIKLIIINFIVLL